jgi:hypothetical protein
MNIERGPFEHRHKIARREEETVTLVPPERLSVEIVCAQHQAADCDRAQQENRVESFHIIGQSKSRARGSAARLGRSPIEVKATAARVELYSDIGRERRQVIGRAHDANDDRLTTATRRDIQLIAEKIF